MPIEKELEQYFSVIIENGLYTTKRNLRNFVDRIFEGVDLKNKSVLEIGGGFGLLSFYAACRGAKYVINVEPDSDGHRGNSYKTFQSVKNAMPGLQNIEFEASTFQNYKNEGKKFDVVVLYNSINHLNEEACIHLRDDPEAKQIYKEIFDKLAAMCNPKAKLIFGDCSNYNLFGQLKLTNPLAPSIEWHKHQSPKLWSKLLEEHGYANPNLSWSSPNTLGAMGKFFLSNKLASYLTLSHFCLKMDYQGEPAQAPSTEPVAN